MSKLYFFWLWTMTTLGMEPCGFIWNCDKKATVVFHGLPVCQDCHKKMLALEKIRELLNE